MQKRPHQIIMLVLLLATAVGAFFLFTIDRRTDQIISAEQDVAARLVRIGNGIAAMGAAQQSYIAPGQTQGSWFDRTATLAERLSEDLRELRLRLRSPKAVEAFDALVRACDALVDADNRIRQNLGLGQTLMAADVIFSDGRNILDLATTRIAELRDAEQAAYRADRATASLERWLIFGLMAVSWSLAVARKGSASPVEAPNQQRSPKVPVDQSNVPPSIDLAAAAALCSDLSRVATTVALPGLLSRAASLLDASGIILWMSAGEQLFAVTGHGYDPGILPRFGPIPRSADNAAAVAWRTGKVATVASGRDAAGAVVAPMFGPEGCIGVLAVELRHGRELDPAAQAVATMIAAQLATAVSAWPAASQAHPVLELTLEEPPDAVRRPA